jgi:rhamnosyltransferase
MDRICAVVVTYQPDFNLLRENLLASRAQVDYLVVVDNGSNAETLERINDFAHDIDCEVLQLGENLGVAAAQNRGIARARNDGCNFVVLLDQDSNPAPDMVVTLRRALADLTACGTPFAAVGPRLVDPRTGVSTPFVGIRMFGTTRKICLEGSHRLISTDFLVSSGMLIPLAVLDRVGLPEEGLFIDNVDLEWCFRARSMGLPVYGVCDAVMAHSVGDEVVQLGDYIIHLHHPIRQYYIMRNRILLYQRSYSPWVWVVQDFFRMLFKLVAFSLFFTPRCQNISMMIRGIKDGLNGKMGKFR